MSSEQLTERALALPLEERVRLAQRLWESVFGDAPGRRLSDIDVAQIAIERCREFDCGAEPEFAYEDVMDEARRELKGGGT